MTKRSRTAAVLFIAALTLSSFAFAGESPNNNKGEIQNGEKFAVAAATAARSPLMATSLSALFTAMADNFTIHPDGRKSAEQQAYTDVIIARIHDDGAHETACVATEQAALNFFAFRDKAAVNANMQEK